MNWRTLLPIAMFAGGIGAIAASVATGQAEISLFIIFPVFTGSSWLFVLGTLLIILSFIVGFALLAMGRAVAGIGQLAAEPPGQRVGETERPRTSYGGVIFIGPVPIAFGSSRSMALAMLVIGVVAFVVLLALVLLLA